MPKDDEYYRKPNNQEEPQRRRIEHTLGDEEAQAMAERRRLRAEARVGRRKIGEEPPEIEERDEKPQRRKLAQNGPPAEPRERKKTAQASAAQPEVPRRTKYDYEDAPRPKERVKQPAAEQRPQERIRKEMPKARVQKPELKQPLGGAPKTQRRPEEPPQRRPVPQKTAPQRPVTRKPDAPERKRPVPEGALYAAPARRTPRAAAPVYAEAPRHVQRPPQNRQLSRPQSRGLVRIDKEEPPLHYRHELKYYINYYDYTVLRSRLRHLLRTDENAGPNGEYLIRSLYFDDRDETALAEKMSGVPDRAKYRVRIYNYSDKLIRFEKKIKNGQYIAKKSISLSRKEYESIIAGDFAFLLLRPEPLAHEIYLEMRQKALKPRVVVDYIREAFVMPVENVRITFDRDLHGGLMEGSIFDPLLPVVPMFDKGLMVLEVKFDGYLPDYVRGVLEDMEAPLRSAVSKYVLCRKYE